VPPIFSNKKATETSNLVETALVKSNQATKFEVWGQVQGHWDENVKIVFRVFFALLRQKWID